MDELLQSGVLEDVGSDTDDIQKELDEAGSAAGVDKGTGRDEDTARHRASRTRACRRQLVTAPRHRPVNFPEHAIARF
jgi:hypothetical protein